MLIQQIHINLLKGHNSVNLSSAEILDFSTAQYIQLRMQKIILPNDKMAMLDNSFKRKLFYSIKDIFIGGRCICNGHAKKCKQMSENAVSFSYLVFVTNLFSNELMKILTYVLVK